MEPTAWFLGPVLGRGTTAIVSVAAASSGDIFAVKSAPFSRSSLLQREQSILASLNSPSIISYLGFQITKDPTSNLFYNLFLEFAGGGSISDELHRRGGGGGGLTEAETRSHARDILAGLSHLHSAGVVHCDLKPENVLIGSDGRAKIGDLGSARRISAEQKEIRGSPMYMAPEAVRGEEQGAPADIWSFGCTLIEIATGRPPWPDFAGPAEGIRRIGFSGEVPAVPDCFSDEAKDFVSNCLKKDPLERWTADELLRHPFVECSICEDVNWVSPKSTLDLRPWESIEEEDEEEFCDESVAGRIQELASGSAAPNWTWNADWVDVRSMARECVEETEVFFAVSDAGGELGRNELFNSDDVASTSGGEEIVEIVLGGETVRRESCGGCGLEERGCELISLCREMRIVDIGDGYSLGFLIGSLLRLLFFLCCCLV